MDGGVMKQSPLGRKRFGGLLREAMARSKARRVG
jgi:hypothetical protein